VQLITKLRGFSDGGLTYLRHTAYLHGDQCTEWSMSYMLTSQPSTFHTFKTSELMVAALVLPLLCLAEPQRLRRS